MSEQQQRDGKGPGGRGGGDGGLGQAGAWLMSVWDGMASGSEGSQQHAGRRPSRDEASSIGRTPRSVNPAP